MLAEAEVKPVHGNPAKGGDALSDSELANAIAS